MKELGRLIDRRDRRGTWIYVVCLVLWSLQALFYAEEASFHSGVALGDLWYLGIPFLVIGAQLLYPTLLGWAGVLSGLCFFIVTGFYFLIRNFGWSQWRVDTSGFIGGLAVLIVLLAVGVGLYRARP